MPTSFPMPANPQFMLDLDGTTSFYCTSAGAGVVALTQGNLQTLCDWNDGTSLSAIAVNTAWHYVFLFPEVRNITAISFRFTWATTAQQPTVNYSTDTTNGINGTWLQAVDGTTGNQYYNCSQTGMRTFVPLNLVGVKAIRLTWQTATTNTGTWTNLNIFGSYTPAGLQFVQELNTNPATAEYMNFGDVMRSENIVKKFRVRNNHATLTANNVAIGVAASPNIGQTATGVQFSLDGTNYSSTVNIASIAPTAISGDIWMRRAVPSNATQIQFGVTSVSATAGSWT